MADAGHIDTKKLLGDVLDKLTSLETKMATVVNGMQKSEQQDEPPGVLELRFPEYDGKDDPAIWLHRCELFFRLQRTVEEDKVWLAAFHMSGAAYDWYRYLESNRGGAPTWPQLAESLGRRFGAPTRGGALGDLVLAAAHQLGRGVSGRVPEAP